MFTNGTFWFYTDYRKVIAVTKPDAFALLRMQDCVEHTESMQFVTKLDLLKCSWQVPLTTHASEISAFGMADIFLQYAVMSFGLHSAPASFQWPMHKVLGDIKKREAIPR